SGAVGGPFYGKRARHIGHGLFGGGIADGFVDRIGPFTQDRGDVDDTATLPALNHLPANFLTAQKDRREIDVKRLLPSVERMPFGTTDRGYASVIHQNINRPQGLPNLLQSGIDLHFVAQVSLDSEGLDTDRLKLPR